MKTTILIFALVLAAAAGCRRDDPSKLLLSGTLEFTEHSVGARAAGRVAEASFEEGDRVKAGQLLARLDRYEQAARDLERARRLLREGGGTEQAFEQARLALEDQEVRSPVDGVVLVKAREAGEVLSAGSAVAVVGEDASPWVRVYVPEGQVNRVRPGQAATLSFDGLDRALKGHVAVVSPKAEFTPRNVQTPEERVTQAFAVKVVLDERDGRLRPGVSADVALSF